MDKTSKITRGNIKKFYDSYLYNDLAITIKSNNNKFFRTIHSCKGDEFNNVLLMLENEKDLDFILNPNIGDEENRINYVALSRAKENIFINVPNLSEDIEEDFKALDINVIRV